MLVNASTAVDGIALTFSAPINSETAADVDHYEVERWNYRRTANYGSDHWSIERRDEAGHDTVGVERVTLSEDGRTVQLRFESMVPAETLRVRYRLRATDGTRVEDVVYFTVHRLPGV